MYTYRSNCHYFLGLISFVICDFVSDWTTFEYCTLALHTTWKGQLGTEFIETLPCVKNKGSG